MGADSGRKSKSVYFARKPTMLSSQSKSRRHSAEAPIPNNTKVKRKFGFHRSHKSESHVGQGKSNAKYESHVTRGKSDPNRPVTSELEYGDSFSIPEDLPRSNFARKKESLRYIF